MERKGDEGQEAVVIQVGRVEGKRRRGDECLRPPEEDMAAALSFTSVRV